MAYGRGRRPAVGLLLGLVMAANLFATLEGQGQDPAAAAAAAAAAQVRSHASATFRPHSKKR